MSNANARRLLNENEAGDVLGMLPRRVIRLARKGIIPSVVLPDREIRFCESDLWEWIQDYKRPAAEGNE